MVLFPISLTTAKASGRIFSNILFLVSFNLIFILSFPLGETAAESSFLNPFISSSNSFSFSLMRALNSFVLARSSSSLNFEISGSKALISSIKGFSCLISFSYFVPNIFFKINPNISFYLLCYLYLYHWLIRTN
ncbi:hypothetical protein ES703_54422 [subsurface metagenome]